jgi:hypothetical protein
MKASGVRQRAPLALASARGRHDDSSLLNVPSVCLTATLLHNMFPCRYEFKWSPFADISPPSCCVTTQASPHRVLTALALSSASSGAHTHPPSLGCRYIHRSSTQSVNGKSLSRINPWWRSCLRDELRRSTCTIKVSVKVPRWGVNGAQVQIQSCCQGHLHASLSMPAIFVGLFVGRPR